MTDDPTKPTSASNNPQNNPNRPLPVPATPETKKQQDAAKAARENATSPSNVGAANLERDRDAEARRKAGQ
jgi:hypothetical protein